MRLALSSVYEGDATMLTSIYLYGNTTPSEWSFLAYRASFSDRSLITATNISARVNEIACFPYLQGAQFIAKLWLDGKGWAQVNHAYADPPRAPPSCCTRSDTSRSILRCADPPAGPGTTVGQKLYADDQG